LLEKSGRNTEKSIGGTVVITKLENQQIAVVINSFGAELCNLKLKQDGTEYMWQADPEYWGRHAPVLFPIVGRLIDDEYIMDDQTYHLPSHGFARNMEFELIDQGDKHVEFRSLANDKTLQNYPRRFELVIGYTLNGNECIIEYKVRNKDNKIMYFSIGAHPGFRCPLQTGECFEDYYLEFPQKETVYKYILEQGLLSTRTEMVLNDDNIIPLSYDIFKEDALIFKDLQSNSVTLKSRKSTKTVTVKFTGFTYHGIWSKPNGNAPFICIEPWYGIADTVGGDKQFTHKEGILSLQPEECFTCQYSITIS
jgi:galactose mutarotase-like enzyme